MRKKLSLLAVVLLTMTLLSIPSFLAFAGHNNQNGDNGSQGTGKVNGLDGCRPSEEAGNVWIQIPGMPIPPFTTGIWEGGPCCAAYSHGPVGTFEGEPVYMPNQCCNPPDQGPTGVPGNHCVCFMNRGWPIPNALPV
jgi:hypothetical protein